MDLLPRQQLGQLGVTIEGHIVVLVDERHVLTLGAAKRFAEALKRKAHASKKVMVKAETLTPEFDLTFRGDRDLAMVLWRRFQYVFQNYDQTVAMLRAAQAEKRKILELTSQSDTMKIEPNDQGGSDLCPNRDQPPSTLTGTA